MSKLVGSHNWKQIQFYKLNFHYIIYKCRDCGLGKKEIYINRYEEDYPDTIYILNGHEINFLTCNEVIMKDVL